MSTSIGIFEAKTHFSALLERVEHGESITITKHGRQVATISPVKAKDPKKIQEAVERFIEMRKSSKHPSSGMTWKELRDEGRKW